MLTALRLAAYQMLYLSRVPARAAINESVDLVKRARKVSAAPFANAVLRKLADAASASTETETTVAYRRDNSRGSSPILSGWSSAGSNISVPETPKLFAATTSTFRLPPFASTAQKWKPNSKAKASNSLPAHC